MAGIIEEWARELDIKNEGPGQSGCLRAFARVFNLSPMVVSRANRGDVSDRVGDLLFYLQYLKGKGGMHHGFKRVCEVQNKAIIRIDTRQVENVRRGYGKVKA